MVYFYSVIRYKLFLLASFQTALLHCMIYSKTLVGVESWLPWTRATIKRYLFRHLSLLCWSKLHNPLLPSCQVPELGAVCHSDGLLHLFNSVFLSFGSFCFKSFLPNLQPLSYGTSCETKLEVLLIAGSCCTGYCAYISVSFSSHVFKQSCTKNSIKKSCAEIGTCPFRGGF
jgi:hypothetical protein